MQAKHGAVVVGNDGLCKAFDTDTAFAAFKREAHGRRFGVLMESREGLAGNGSFIGCSAGCVFCTGLRIVPSDKVRLVDRFREGVGVAIDGDKRLCCTFL